MNPASMSGESSTVLFHRAQAGDQDAVNALCARYRPRLRNWAAGRLPSYARDLKETEDLVQDAIVRAMKNLEHFELRNDGAVLAYLRQAVLNKIRDEIRRSRRKPPHIGLSQPRRSESYFVSPLEECIGEEATARYEAALSRLRPDDRALIIAKLEMDSDYDEMASALGKPSAEAARKAAARALIRLAREMGDGSS